MSKEIDSGDSLEDIMGRFRAARNENSPADVLANLAGYGPDVREVVAMNRNCPPEVLAKLAGDRNYTVRCAAAKNPSCSSDALAKLNKNKSASIRMAVADNPNCPAALLTKLSSDVAMCVRYAVADNSACPKELLDDLAADESCNVRYAVADNPNCTAELRKIAIEGNHSSPAVIATPAHLKNLPARLKPFQKQIESTLKPFVDMEEDESIRLIDNEDGETKFGKKLRLWQSKNGGFPYFPKVHEYPTDPNGRPLLLLVQINFGDMPKLDLFPEKGILQIYLGSAKGYPYGLNLRDRTDQSYFRVLYFHEIIYDMDALITDFDFLPKDIDMPCHGTSPIRFELKYEPISVGDYRFEQTNFSENEDMDEEISEAYREKFSGYGSKIGGYPGFTQRDPRGFPQFESKGLKDGADEFELLLQLDGGIGWGDLGLANFFIRKADLQKRDFSKVLYNWDCF